MNDFEQWDSESNKTFLNELRSNHHAAGPCTAPDFQATNLFNVDVYINYRPALWVYTMAPVVVRSGEYTQRIRSLGPFLVSFLSKVCMFYLTLPVMPLRGRIWKGSCYRGRMC